jgi:hypothetical protein
MLRVRVRRPSVRGDRVSYSWKQSIPNRFMYRNRFYFEYPGLDLSTLDEVVHWNLFLGLMIPVFQLFEEPTTIELPSSVPARLIEFWLLYHDALDIEVKTPKGRFPRLRGSWSTIACPSRLPWNERLCRHVAKESDGARCHEAPEGRAAILFGGGKDSTFGLGLLTELLGDQNVSLLRYVNPMTGTARPRRSMKQLRQRAAVNLIRPVQSVIDVDYLEVETNFSSNCRETTTSYACHVALYTASCLPLVLSKKIDYLVFNLERSSYPTHEVVGEHSTPTFKFRRSRPEFFEATSKLYREFFDADLAICNLSYPITELMSFEAIFLRYPKLAPSMMMCEATLDDSNRWCRECRKCCQFALYSLYLQQPDPRFDYDGFFEKSSAAEAIRAHMASTPSSHWDPTLSHTAHFASFRHALHGLDVDFLTRFLSKPALETVLALKARYGAEPFPTTERFAIQALEFVPSKLRGGYERIVGELFEGEPRLPIEERGNSQVAYRFDQKVDLELE